MAVLSYETLDAIADSFNPLLALIAIFLIALPMFKSAWKSAGQRALAFAVMVMFSYGGMYLDKTFAIWPSFGMDYSTHSAVALGLVIFLSFTAPRFLLLWVGALITYVVLMLYQGYHSLADILTTCVAVGTPMVLYFLLPLNRMANPNKQGTQSLNT